MFMCIYMYIYIYIYIYSIMCIVYIYIYICTSYVKLLSGPRARRGDLHEDVAELVVVLFCLLADCCY